MISKYGVTSAILVSLLATACGSRGLCVDCASGPPTIDRVSFLPIRSLAAPAGGILWVPSRAEAWTLSAVFTVDVRALEVVTETTTHTALRAPEGLPRSTDWVVQGDGETIARVAIDDGAGQGFLSADELELELIGRDVQRLLCSGGCFADENDRPAPTPVDVPLLRWRTSLTSDELASVAIDVWRLPAEDPADEQAPRTGDTVMVPREWRETGGEIVIALDDADEDVVLRLRSLADGAVGPLSGSEGGG